MTNPVLHLEENNTVNAFIADAFTAVTIAMAGFLALITVVAAG